MTLVGLLLIMIHAVQAFMVCCFGVKVCVAPNKVDSVSEGMVFMADVGGAVSVIFASVAFTAREITVSSCVFSFSVSVGIISFDITVTVFFDASEFLVGALSFNSMVTVSFVVSGISAGTVSVDVDVTGDIGAVR